MEILYPDPISEKEKALYKKVVELAAEQNTEKDIAILIGVPRESWFPIIHQAILFGRAMGRAIINKTIYEKAQSSKSGASQCAVVLAGNYCGVSSKTEIKKKTKKTPPPITNKVI